MRKLEQHGGKSDLFRGTNVTSEEGGRKGGKEGRANDV